MGQTLIDKIDSEYIKTEIRKFEDSWEQIDSEKYRLDIGGKDTIVRRTNEDLFERAEKYFKKFVSKVRKDENYPYIEIPGICPHEEGIDFSWDRKEKPNLFGVLHLDKEGNSAGYCYQINGGKLKYGTLQND